MENKIIVAKFISDLNKPKFNRLVRALWKKEDITTPFRSTSTHSLSRLAEGVLEQRHVELNLLGANVKQQFDLIVPLFEPIDLMEIESDFKLSFQQEQSILKRYSNIFKRRENKWHEGYDGELCLSNLLFTSQIFGLPEDVYYKRVIPRLYDLVESYDFFDTLGICTIDSFLNKSPAKIKKVLKNLLSKDHLELSIKLKEGKITLEHYLSQRYLDCGVLRRDLVPVDTVINLTPPSITEVVKEFESLLNSTPSESTLENFLKAYYREVFGPQYNQIETQLWLKCPELDINSKNRRIDIFLRNAVERDWELIELKVPKKITKYYRGIPTFTSEILNAISQLKAYANILKQDSIKQKFAQNGLEYYQPELRLVIGGKSSIPLQHWRHIKKENERNLKISTTEELHQQMKNRYLDFLALYS